MLAVTPGIKQMCLLIFISATLLTGCNTRWVPCLNQYVTPAFVGFKNTDLDTLVIREYKMDDNFLTLLDTAVIITDNAELTSGTSNDTTFVELNVISGEEKYLFPDHDWQIYIPAQNRAVSMSGFESPQTNHRCGILGGDLCPGCANPINSLFQDGQQVIPQYRKIPNAGGDRYVTYIRR